MSKAIITAPDDDGVVYFREHELVATDGGLHFAGDFIADLAWLRMVWGRPMHVISCCRSFVHNQSIGGHPRSLHVYDRPFHAVGGTAAIDITFPADVALAWRFEDLLIEQGWSWGKRPGMYHLDRRDYAGLPPGSFLY